MYLRAIFVSVAISFFLQDALSVPWRSLPKRMSKLYFAMRGMVNCTALFVSKTQENEVILINWKLKTLLLIGSLDCVNKEDIVKDVE